MSARRVSRPVQQLVKSAVAVGLTSDVTWAGPLVPTQPMEQAFIGGVDERWSLPKIGAVRVPSTKVVGATQTASATGYFVGESAPKPLTTLGYAAMSLTPRKCVADLAVSEELLAQAVPDALALVMTGAMTATATTAETALWDPANAGIANIKPASLTNGVSAITPAGDYQNQVGQVLAGISGGSPTKPVLIVSLQSALRLTALRDLASIGVKVIVTPAAGRTADCGRCRRDCVYRMTAAASGWGRRKWKCLIRRRRPVPPARS